MAQSSSSFSTKSAKHGVFLHAAWHDLLMVNYEVDPHILTPLLPKGTEIDLWQGKTFVSMVGFMFLETRVLGVPIPFHRNFEEVNLRFYVRRQTPDGIKRGVVFVKEIVPRFAIAAVARIVYNERYVTLPMTHYAEHYNGKLQSGSQVEYRWKHQGAWSNLSCSVQGVARLPEQGSQEEFITEHYWGYAKQRDGSTVEYAVEHPQWRVWQTSQVQFECNIAALYGNDFEPSLSARPVSAFVAEGSPVLVRKGVRL